jgi:hypothetical protein
MGGFGGGQSSSNYGLSPGGQEALNAPADSSPAEGDLQPGSGTLSRGFAAGGGGFGRPAGGGGPAVRGGANQSGGDAIRESLDRQNAPQEDSVALKQDIERKPARDESFGQDKNQTDGASSRGGAADRPEQLAKLLPKAVRNVAPEAAPLPAEPTTEPQSAPPAATATPPASGAKPAARPAVTGAGAAPKLAAGAKDAGGEQAGKSVKESPDGDKSGNRPLGPVAENPVAENPGAENEERREKLDASSPKRRYAGDGVALGAAPASLYFNPQLIADENGRATIEFKMPPVESEYRLLIDALGNGRIGSLQQVIEVREPAK